MAKRHSPALCNAPLACSLSNAQPAAHVLPLTLQRTLCDAHTATHAEKYRRYSTREHAARRTLQDTHSCKAHSPLHKSLSHISLTVRTHCLSHATRRSLSHPAEYNASHKCRTHPSHPTSPHLTQLPYTLCTCLSQVPLTFPSWEKVCGARPTKQEGIGNAHPHLTSHAACVAKRAQTQTQTHAERKGGWGERGYTGAELAQQPGEE